MKTVAPDGRGPDEMASLRSLLPRDVLVTNPVELIAYELDGSLGHGAAQGVVLPRKTEELVTALRWAAEHDLPVVPRGAGTGLSGGALAPQGGLIVSLARMQKILELDEAGRSVVIQPGIIHQTFDEFVRTKGLYYPPDPASGRACTLGGNLGENAGGPHCFKYGVTTNYITGLTTVLTGGRVLKSGGRAFDYPEYDLTGLLVGSEGTLGVMTEAQVRLVRNIPGIKTLLAMFNSVEEAGEAVSAVIARWLLPATLEMMDRNMIGIVENYVHAGLPVDADALLIIEADGYPESLDSQMDEFMAVLKERGVVEMRLAKTAAERDRIWFARKSAFGAIAQISPAYLIVDGTVPRSKLAATLGAINGICIRHDLRVGYVFHAGDGNLHPLIMFDPSDADMVRRVHLAGDEVMALCVAQGGTITGEHGVGSEKQQYMTLMYNAGELQSMRDIKQVFDPRGLMNPAKIIPDEPAYVPESRPPTADYPRSAAPASVEETAELMKTWAAATGSPTVRIRGGGTKSSPQTLGPLPPADAVLSSRALTGVVEYKVNDLYVTVRAGTPLAALQAELAPDKVWVPLASPWAESTIGGIVATNFNAPLRMRYGSIRDLILAITMVLPDGRVVRAGKPVVKNVAGYDLVRLFIGSHGTLGFITDVTFKLLPFPRARSTMVIPVPPVDSASGASARSLGRALRLGSRLLKVCMVSSGLLLCGGCQTHGQASPLPRLSTPSQSESLPRSFGHGTSYALVYTAEGMPEDVEAEFRQVADVLKAEGCDGDLRPDVPSGSEAWAQWLKAASAGDLVIRAALPPVDLPAALVDMAPTLGEAPFIADLAFGQVWVQDEGSPSGDLHLDVIRGIATSMGGYAMALSAPSATTRTLDPFGYKPDGLDLMRALKARWDPRGQVNPGAFVV